MAKKIPQTITDRDWKSLAARAQKVGPLAFSKEAIQQRKRSEAQRNKANQS